jgi:Mg2+-importing ATPase
MFSGLSHEEVLRRRATSGYNRLPDQRHPFFRLLWRQCQGVFNILLFIAATVTAVLGHYIDAAFIIGFVALGIGLSLYQEFKSNAASAALQKYLVRYTTVCRAGAVIEIPVEELVLGDILKLESGDVVPADASIVATTDLAVDETTFTGESIPVIKTPNGTSLQLPEHMVYQGSTIIRGAAYATVTAIGQNTKLAHIAASVATTESDSVLVAGVGRISTFILRTTVITLIGIVVANILIDGTDTNIPELLIFAIALAVSVIPEALPLVLTFSLSRGALQLAQRGVIVKRLTSVQDLGSIEILCTDKTGTITENRLVYTNEYIIPECPFHPLVLARLAAHDLTRGHREPFDIAADTALTEWQRGEVNSYTLVEEIAFDPSTRSNGAVVVRSDGYRITIRRGNPEIFIALGLVDPYRVNTWIAEEENRGHRVLGVSYNSGNGEQFGGFVSFVDTLKSTTADTLTAASALGVAITIITGDSLRVARAIGYETKLVHNDTEIIDAGEFFKLPSEVQHARVATIRVFARTTPEQKLSLISLLKEKHTVGFLGEGINDAPALKAAHVSLVVPSAADVAREAADIVLTEPDLRVIVSAIELGRETYANTLKYIRATLVSNFGNFYAVAAASLFIAFLPMLPKQLLLLNLLSDFPMMAIAFDRVSRSEIKKPQQYDFRSLYIVFITLGLVSTVFDFLYFGLFYHISPEVLQTNWFIASVLTEILLILSIRSMLPIEKAGLPAPLVSGLSLIAITLTLSLPLIPVTAAFFGFTPPTLSDMILIVSLALIYLAVSEIVKRPLAKMLKLV